MRFYQTSFECSVRTLISFLQQQHNFSGCSQIYSYIRVYFSCRAWMLKIQFRRSRKPPEIKKEFEETIANGKKNENTDIEKKANNCTANEEDAVKVIPEFEKIIKNNKSDIIWLAYYQDQIFQKFKEKQSFVSMVFKLNVSKSTIVFKITLSKLIDNYPKIKNPSLSLHYFKKHLKMIREICKENASEFK